VKGEKLTFLVTQDAAMLASKVNWFARKHAQHVSEYQGNDKFLQNI
jgi:hypothetical protein